MRVRWDRGPETTRERCHYRRNCGTQMEYRLTRSFGQVQDGEDLSERILIARPLKETRV